MGPQGSQGQDNVGFVNRQLAPIKLLSDLPHRHRGQRRLLRSPLLRFYQGSASHAGLGTRMRPKWRSLWLHRLSLIRVRQESGHSLDASFAERVAAWINCWRNRNVRTLDQLPRNRCRCETPVDLEAQDDGVVARLLGFQLRLLGEMGSSIGGTIVITIEDDEAEVGACAKVKAGAVRPSAEPPTHLRHSGGCTLPPTGRRTVASPLSELSGSGRRLHHPVSESTNGAAVCCCCPKGKSGGAPPSAWSTPTGPRRWLYRLSHARSHQGIAF